MGNPLESITAFSFRDIDLTKFFVTDGNVLSHSSSNTLIKSTRARFNARLSLTAFSREPHIAIYV